MPNKQGRLYSDSGYYANGVWRFLILDAEHHASDAEVRDHQERAADLDVIDGARRAADLDLLHRARHAADFDRHAADFDDRLRLLPIIGAAR